MDGAVQARYVAVYRAKHSMDAMVAQQQAADMRAKAKPGGKYGRKG